MSALYSFFAILVFGLMAYFGVAVWGLQKVFGIAIPYTAFGLFALGIVYRVLKWGRSPVPFAIATTCGQQKSLPWVKASYLENPHSTLGVLGRMALEVLVFRSLFRNTRVELKGGPRLIYGGNKYLWLGAMAFHWTFLIILLRHFRFFTEPVPFFVRLLQNLDGFFQVGVPIFYLSSLIILAALGYLFLRRFLDPKVRYISLATDYFALLLILSVAASGVIMRHFTKVDIVKVKELAMGLVSLHPAIPEGGIGLPFYIHLFFVCILLAYFPFSKLVHMGGIFLSPTRNLRADSRRRRHVNPWNPPVEVHTYEEWEDDFRDKMKAAGLPLDRE
jgi:nitrate reductase gamma subunit